MPKPNVRDKLLAAAFELFYTKGYNACGVLDVTNAAGVPKGSFYNHFKSKEEMALAALDLYQSYLSADLLKDKSKSPIKRLRSLFESYVAIHAKWGYERGCMMGNFGAELSSQSSAIRKALKKHFDGFCNMIAAVVQEAQDNGELSAKGDADRIARFLVNSWEGAIVRARIVRTSVPFDDFFAMTFDSALKT
jgi:TetR/AcrR family transcriptional repressor of nem operon